MKKFITRIVNSIKFALKYFKWASTKRKAEVKQKEIIVAMNPGKLTSRDKQRLKANKEKIKNGQPSSYNGMIRAFRRKRLAAQQSGKELYLGSKNKYGLREVLNGQKDAAHKCQLIIKPGNVKRLSVNSIIHELKTA